MCGFNWMILCADFNGRLYVRIYMDAYLCGLDGSLYVWIYVDDSMCGFKWKIICADFNGRL